MNPITDGRLSKGLSMPALAKRLGLSRQYLSRAEQGTYSSLNPALQKWVANALSIEPAAVHRRYVQFQKASRRATVERIEPTRLNRRMSREPGHIIFERWRSGYWSSPTQFAVGLCVHPDMVQRYEEGIQKQMPKQVFDALYENDLIDKSWTEILPEGEAADASLTA
ncbi:helix-turn-helix domain-containing protein [Streptomyces griseosporeus]|uniref:helix-turn-helix domain-containing protein n=1 Tax=Streptomyces griseosporeus TaxID=1910 RepID=UPI00167E39C8|nr:helix-turn-helix domain-containing protein [Streptomyces griseosporeus]